MKKKNLMMLLTLLCILSINTANAAHKEHATINDCNVKINENSERILGYNINGNNYYKLRDLAYVMSDTSSCFDVTWNGEKRQVEVITGTPYSGEAENSLKLIRENDVLTEFDEELFTGLVESITVFEDKLVFEWKDGMTVEWKE